MDFNKIIKFLKKHQMLKNILLLIPVIGLGICMFLYPIWWINGNLDGDTLAEDIYIKSATAIAIYGGFVGHLVWFIQKIRKKNLI